VTRISRAPFTSIVDPSISIERVFIRVVLEEERMLTKLPSIPNEPYD
jgi:hypothetical protein